MKVCVSPAWLLAVGCLAGMAGATAADPTRPAPEGPSEAESAGIGGSVPSACDLHDTFTALGLVPRPQGARDSCSLFAVTALAEYAYGRSHPEAPLRFSEEYLIWAANEATGRNGDQAMFFEAVHGLAALGICREDLHPYRPAGADALPPSSEAIADAATRSHRWRVHWIRRWNVRTPLDDDALAVVKRVLADGHPVACGLRWPRAGTGAELLEVPPPDAVFDGHSIVITGFRDDPGLPGGGVVRFRNSAGPAWGDGGYGLMAYAYLRAYANDALWLTYGPPDSERPVRRLEAETLPVLSGDPSHLLVESMDAHGAGMWSGGSQLLCRTDRGARVTFGLPVDRTGPHRVRLLATAAPRHSVIRVTFDEASPGTTADLYAGRISPSGPIELGIHDFTGRSHRLTIEVIDRNPASSGHDFALDAVELLAP